MILKYLPLVFFVFGLFSGCSEKNEEKEVILKDSGSVIEPMPNEPKYQTLGCLHGCRGLPCDERIRCVKRNCPKLKVTCDDSEHEVFKDKK